MIEPTPDAAINPDDFRAVGPALGPSAQGQRADAFLARTYPFHSRSAWKALCKRTHLLCNGRAIRGSYRLRSGDQLSVFHPLAEEPDVDTAIELIAESSGVMALFKPGNLPMHEAGQYRRRTFGAILAERFGREWAPVHRLDRETSGIVICAATAPLRRQISLDFEARRVRKRYLAILQGHVAWDERIVDEPLAEIQDGLRPRYAVDPRGSPAWTSFHTLALSPHASLVEVRPRTGKPNQIRVHAAWTGHALVGDKVYHPDPAVFAAYHRYGDSPHVQALAGFKRHALHAAAIELHHPETGRSFRAEAAMPEDLTQLWAKFAGDDAFAGTASAALPVTAQPSAQ